MVLESLSVNPKGWGPLKPADANGNCTSPTHPAFPFASSQRHERLGRPCDFTFQTSLRLKEQPKKADDFVVVQETRVKKPKAYKKPVHPPQQQTQQAGQQWGGPQAHIVGGSNVKPSLAPRSKWQKQNAALQAHRQAQRMQQNAWMQRAKAFTEWSVDVESSWSLVSEIQLGDLPKLRLKPQDVVLEDLEWRGSLGQIDRKVNEGITARKPALLKAAEKGDRPLDFYWNTTTMDELLAEKVLEDDNVTVAATDRCLAALMSAAQSRYSWHLIIRRFGDNILIDKKDGSTVDTVQVNETNRTDPPNPQDPNRIDRPTELSAEAVRITQALSQQVLGAETKKFERAPFEDDGDNPARRAYRYRTLTLPVLPGADGKPLTIVTRADVDAAISTASGDKLAVVRALLEADKSAAWSTQLEKSKGSLMALEFKNNAGSLARWISHCLLASAEVLYLGWVSRAVHTDNKKHRVLACQQHNAAVLSQQVGLHEANVWAVLRYFLDRINTDTTEDGTYILVKDPVKPVVKIYKCPDEEEEE